MRIAIVTSGFLPALDGVAIAVWQRVRVLSRGGHEVLVLCPEYRPAYPQWSEYVGDILPGVRVVGLPSQPLLDLELERNFCPQAVPLLEAELARFAPEIVHVDEPERIAVGLRQLPGRRFARKRGLPYFGFLHTNIVEYGDDYFGLPLWLRPGVKRLTRAIFARIYNACTLTLVASQTAAAIARSYGIARVVRGQFLGIDSQHYRQIPRSAGFWRDRGQTDWDDRAILITVGRLTPDKGWGFLQGSFAQLAASPLGDRLAWTVLGDGPLREEIATQARSHGLALTCFGSVAPDDVGTYLANSDIYVTASQKETFGLTVLEASACGLPVLGVAAGGVAEQVRSNETGLLFAPGNGDDFLGCLATLVGDRALGERLGEAARQQAQNFDWERATQNLLDVWQAHGQACPSLPESSEP